MDDGAQALALHLSKASRDTTRSVLALVAVNQQGVVGTIQNDTQSLHHHLGLHLDHVFVGRHDDDDLADSSGPEKLNIWFRIGFGDESEDGLQFEASHETKVLWKRKAAPEDAAVHDSPEVGRRKVRGETIRSLSKGEGSTAMVRTWCLLFWLGLGSLPVTLRTVVP